MVQYFLLAFLIAATPDQQNAARINGSNATTFESSIQSMKQSLPARLQTKFEQAVVILIGQFAENAPDSGQSHEELAKSLNDKTAQDIIALAEQAVTEIQQKEKERRFKGTYARVPTKPLTQLSTSSLGCQELVATSIATDQNREYELFRVSEESFFVSEAEAERILSEDTIHLEAISQKGADKLALSVDGDILKFMTGASVGAGHTEAAQYTILKHTDEFLFAILQSQHLLFGESLNTLTLNKKNGFAVWTKTYPKFFISDVPHTLTNYYRCQ